MVHWLQQLVEDDKKLFAQRKALKAQAVSNENLSADIAELKKTCVTKEDMVRFKDDIVETVKTMLDGRVLATHGMLRNMQDIEEYTLGRILLFDETVDSVKEIANTCGTRLETMEQTLGTFAPVAEKVESIDGKLDTLDALKSSIDESYNTIRAIQKESGVIGRGLNELSQGVACLDKLESLEGSLNLVKDRVSAESLASMLHPISQQMDPISRKLQDLDCLGGIKDSVDMVKSEICDKPLSAALHSISQMLVPVGERLNSLRRLEGMEESIKRIQDSVSEESLTVALLPLSNTTQSVLERMDCFSDLGDIKSTVEAVRESVSERSFSAALRPLSEKFEPVVEKIALLDSLSVVQTSIESVKASLSVESLADFLRPLSERLDSITAKISPVQNLRRIEDSIKRVEQGVSVNKLQSVLRPIAQKVECLEDIKNSLGPLDKQSSDQSLRCSVGQIARKLDCLDVIKRSIEDTSLNTSEAAWLKVLHPLNLKLEALNDIKGSISVLKNTAEDAYTRALKPVSEKLDCLEEIKTLTKQTQANTSPESLKIALSSILTRLEVLNDLKISTTAIETNTSKESIQGAMSTILNRLESLDSIMMLVQWTANNTSFESVSEALSPISSKLQCVEDLMSSMKAVEANTSHDHLRVITSPIWTAVTEIQTKLNDLDAMKATADTIASHTTPLAMSGYMETLAASIGGVSQKLKVLGEVKDTVASLLALKQEEALSSKLAAIEGSIQDVKVSIQEPSAESALGQLRLAHHNLSQELTNIKTSIHTRNDENRTTDAIEQLSNRLSVLHDGLQTIQTYCETPAEVDLEDLFEALVKRQDLHDYIQHILDWHANAHPCRLSPEVAEKISDFGSKLQKSCEEMTLVKQSGELTNRRLYALINANQTTMDALLSSEGLHESISRTLSGMVTLRDIQTQNRSLLKRIIMPLMDRIDSIGLIATDMHDGIVFVAESVVNIQEKLETGIGSEKEQQPPHEILTRISDTQGAVQSAVEILQKIHEQFDKWDRKLTIANPEFENAMTAFPGMYEKVHGLDESLTICKDVLTLADGPIAKITAFLLGSSSTEPTSLHDLTEQFQDVVRQYGITDDALTSISNIDEAAKQMFIFLTSGPNSEFEYLGDALEVVQNTIMGKINGLHDSVVKGRITPVNVIPRGLDTENRGKSANTMEMIVRSWSMGSQGVGSDNEDLSGDDADTNGTQQNERTILGSAMAKRPTGETGGRPSKRPRVEQSGSHDVDLPAQAVELSLSSGAADLSHTPVTPLGWTDFFIGEPARKRRGMTNELKASGLPGHIKSLIHKQDATKGATRGQLAIFNRERPIECFYSRVFPIQEWLTANGYPIEKGGSASEKTAWWQRIWTDTTQPCPQCQYRKQEVENDESVCFYFLDELNVRAFI